MLPVECRFADETLWLSQALMAELFQVTPQNVTLHLQALYAEGEILEEAQTFIFLSQYIDTKLYRVSSISAVKPNKDKTSNFNFMELAFINETDDDQCTINA